MKRFISFFLTILLFCSFGFFSCNFEKAVYDNAELTQTFEVEEYGIKISAPNNFEENDSSFDLQLTNKNKSLYFGIFGFSKANLSNGTTVRDIFENQKNDLFSKRDNVKVTVAEKTDNLNGKSICSAVYQADKDGNTFEYYVAIIEFDSSDSFAYICVSMNSGDYNTYGTLIRSMAESMTAEAAKGNENTDSVKMKDISVPSIGIRLSIPEEWTEVSSQFDYQANAKDESIGCYIYGYLKSDISSTAEELFEEQNSLLLEAQKNVAVKDEMQTEKLNGKTIYSISYTGDYGTSKFVYDLYMIEFDAPSNRLLWVAVLGWPSATEQNADVIPEIINSITSQG